MAPRDQRRIILISLSITISPPYCLFLSDTHVQTLLFLLNLFPSLSLFLSFSHFFSDLWPPNQPTRRPQQTTSTLSQFCSDINSQPGGYWRRLTAEFMSLCHSRPTWSLENFNRFVVVTSDRHICVERDCQDLSCFALYKTGVHPLVWWQTQIMLCEYILRLPMW